MILPPNRLSEVIEAVEAGQPVDYSRVARLLALDMAALGRQFVVEALEKEEEADARFEQILRRENGPGDSA
jgi:antitoxin (DNA-binding transcriptional repressor) of toxin-antitoxin stability system